MIIRTLTNRHLRVESGENYIAKLTYQMLNSVISSPLKELVFFGKNKTAEGALIGQHSRIEVHERD